MKHSIIFSVIVFGLFGGSYAQQVRNVDFTVKGEEIHITYDLEQNENQSSIDYFMDVELYYSMDKGSSWYGPLNKHVSGDIGKTVRGKNKTIIWKPLKSMSCLYSDYVKFKLIAKEAGFTEQVAGVNIEMVAVEGGSFEMGCTSEQGGDCDGDESPVHTVSVDDFYIGKYEVTQAQWEAIIGSNPSRFDDCGGNCPVEKVSWKDVQEFIEKINRKTGKNYRLPTEAEWEYAARGGNNSKGYKYAGSNIIGSVAWYDDNSDGETHPVGQKQANELGIYDMSGNVWEWCIDWYGSDYYSSSPRNNPAGPSSGSNRVLRGGSWISGARYCRVANRYSANPEGSRSYGGFRLVLPR